MRQRLRTVRTLLAKSTLGTPLADSDDDLLARFVRGCDSAAFAELLRRHGPMTLGVCQRVLGDGPDAEDAFQATFLVLALKAAAAPGPSLRAWLHGVAYRVARNARRGRDRRRRHERAILRPEAAPPGPDPHDATELRCALDEELARLPERYRAAFILCHLDGRTRPDAAKELGCSDGTLSSRLARAKDLLQRNLRARGIAPAAALAFPPTAVGVAVAVPPTLAAAAVQTALAVAAAGRVTSVAPPAVAALVKSATAATVRPLVLVAGVVLAAGASAWGVAQEGLAQPGLQPDAMTAADSLREILPPPDAIPSGRPAPVSDRASLTRGELSGIRKGESMTEQVRTGTTRGPHAMADPDPWRSLFRTFALERGAVPPTPPPPADLDRFEAETGIRLPAGYRGYLGVFGPGCLQVGRGNNLREMFISSPYCPDRSLDLSRAVERLRLLREDPPRGMDERMKRLVVFGRDGLGHEYGWDPEEVTDPAAPEFAVYAWYRGDHGYRVSRTFAGFVAFVLDVAARREHSLNPCDREDPGEAAFGAPGAKAGRVFQPAAAD